MPKAYLIGHIRVHDRDAFEEFRKLSGTAIADHGGRILVRNPEADHREGSLRGTVMIVEFDNMEAARRFYESDEYAVARRVRERAAETDLLLVEGVT